MTAYVFDIEADGLNPSVIFCVVALGNNNRADALFWPR
jgi:hypothetical protein